MSFGYGMVTGNFRRPNKVTEGIDASRRVGFALFYQEQERADGLQVINHQMRERIECLLQVLFDLVDSVLHSRNMDAFALAMHIQELLTEWEADAHTVE